MDSSDLARFVVKRTAKFGGLEVFKSRNDIPRFGLINARKNPKTLRLLSMALRTMKDLQTFHLNYAWYDPLEKIFLRRNL